MGEAKRRKKLDSNYGTAREEFPAPFPEQSGFTPDLGCFLHFYIQNAPLKIKVALADISFGIEKVNSKTYATTFLARSWTIDLQQQATDQQKHIQLLFSHLENIGKAFFLTIEVDGSKEEARSRFKEIANQSEICISADISRKYKSSVGEIVIPCVFA